MTNHIITNWLFIVATFCVFDIISIPSESSSTQHLLTKMLTFIRASPVTPLSSPSKHTVGGSTTLRESILKDIFIQRVWHISGIKENQRGNRGREIPSEPNSILSKFPRTVSHCDNSAPAFLFCLWCACVNFRLTSLSLLSPRVFLHPSLQGVVPVRH